MAFPVFQRPVGTPEQTSPWNNQLSNLLKMYQQQTAAKYAPQMMQADIQSKNAASQKNLMISQLLTSMLGGNGGTPSEGMNGEGGIGGNNMQAAALKAFTGIDPYLMSPQETQNLKIAGAVKEAANKNNLTTGASNVTREYLQNKVSLPEPYLGNDATLQIGKDVIAAKLGDEEARERLIQAATANKLVPEYSGAQLGSMGIKGTVHAINQQNEAIKQGWPHFSQKIFENLPADIQKEAENRHNNIVKNINRTRSEFFKSGGESGNNFEPENMHQSPSKGPVITWDDIEHTAIKRKMTQNEVVEKLAKKNGMSIEQFVNTIKRGR